MKDKYKNLRDRYYFSILYLSFDFNLERLDNFIVTDCHIIFIFFKLFIVTFNFAIHFFLERPARM